ncbi:hypothetical protein HYH03_010010 [Edaphochlamys debaryana]|uniref:O-methyltransferase n=1 Tax=Edaphochlamys debaryana TaxID=47281 RepID=A0A835XXJ0_9CHLO|nr:hypothetical protein HYH03_010010 [Edaphochlamys debaryana]|eukprot:KAG2491639.1 hypothetical protein HYH03_010010 [Edaphochlamys debaryana]
MRHQMSAAAAPARVLLATLALITLRGALGEPGPLLLRLDSNVQEILSAVNQLKAATGGSAAGSVAGGQSAGSSAGGCHNGFFTAPKDRKDIAAILQQKGFKTGVELGVQRAWFSAHNLYHWTSCEKYYLVDAWAHQVNYEDLANVDQSKQNEIYNEAVTNLAAYASKTVFLRNYTNDAIKYIPDNVDFVYVDARHDYCGVMEDLKLYWPKIRVGGIMAGHDYLDAPYVKEISGQAWEKCMDGSIHPGAVKGAVDDFFRPLGQHVFVTYLDGPWVTWVVLKG